MPERTVNPRDSVDLVLLLQSFGDSLGTLYPQAHVYDNTNTEIDNSPFDLTLVANNLYTKNNAFQVADSGTYKVVYLVYTDAGHTTRSGSHGEIVDVINVKIQSTTGLGGYGSMKNQGSDVIVDFDIVEKWLKEMEKRQNKKIDKILGTIKQGFKIEAQELDFGEIKGAIKEVEDSIKKDLVRLENPSFVSGISRTVKAENEKLMTAIKKNRSTTIKTKFDKKWLSPMLKAVAESDIKLRKETDSIKKYMIKTIDMKNEESNQKFQTTLDESMNLFEKGLNTLDERIRKKLKFALDGLKTMMYMGRQPKNDINITLKKDDEY